MEHIDLILVITFTAFAIAGLVYGFWQGGFIRWVSDVNYFCRLTTIIFAGFGKNFNS